MYEGSFSCKGSILNYSYENNNLSNPSAGITQNGLSSCDFDNSDTRNTYPEYEIIKSLTHALDVVPTLLDYAGVEQIHQEQVPTGLGLYFGSFQEKDEIYYPTGELMRHCLKVAPVIYVATRQFLRSYSEIVLSL
jgi:hypothetical protein